MPKVNMVQQAAAAQGMTSEQSAQQTAAQDKTQAAQAENRPESHLLKVLDFLTNGIQFENAAERQKEQQTDQAASQRDDANQNPAGMDKRQDMQDARKLDESQTKTQSNDEQQTVRADNEQTSQTDQHIDVDRAALEADDERLMKDRMKVAGEGEELDKARVEQLNQAQVREQQESQDSRARQAAEDEESRSQSN
jgi:hypothetical protein